MSKKLWQAIGKESSPHIASHHQQNASESSNRPPTSRCSQREEGEVSPGWHAEAAQACPQKGKQEDLSIEIQSCESEQMRSQGSNQEIPWCSSKFFVEKAFRGRIRTMGQQVKALQDDLLALRTAVAKGREAQGSGLSSLLNKFYNQFSKTLEDRAVMISCQRCSHSKTLIDQLTRQCWELESKLKEVGKEREEHPMKKIESSLLQERGEVIRRLKAELEVVREENERLYQQLAVREERAREVEGQYKSSLMAFKGEIEAINEACCRKIEQIIQEKVSSESELRLLQEKYLQLQAIYEQGHFKRNAERRFFTHYPEESSPTAAQRHAALFKNIPLKTAEIDLTRKIAPRSTASLAELDLTRLGNLTTSYSPLPSYFQSTPQTRKSRNTSESSFGSALQKLAEIQKDVRKQIKRSKKSFK